MTARRVLVFVSLLGATMFGGVLRAENNVVIARNYDPVIAAGLDTTGGNIRETVVQHVAANRGGYISEVDVA